jgi:hypothetical protein
LGTRFNWIGRQVRNVETWQDEVKRAVEAGEREFGLLNAHHTSRHNLARRCKEILDEQPQPATAAEHIDGLAVGDLS